MYDKTKLFDIKGKDKVDIQEMFETILEVDLLFSIETEVVSNSQIIICYYDKKIDKRLQTDNIISINQEFSNFQIQIKGNLVEVQWFILWNEFNKMIKNPIIFQEKRKRLEKRYEREEEKEPFVVEEKEEAPRSMNDIASIIYKNNSERGYYITKSEIMSFIENFLKKFNRLPNNVEIKSIGLGYIKWINEEMGMDNSEDDL